MCGLIVDEMRWCSVSQHVRLLVGGPTFGSAALIQLAADLPATSREHRNIEHEMEASNPLDMYYRCRYHYKTCMLCSPVNTHQNYLSKMMPRG
jgi:hypothetical protein